MSARVGYPSGSLVWSNGTNFTGLALVELVPPTGYTTVGLANQTPIEQVALQVPLPVQNGCFVASQGLFYNADLTPPSTTYKWSAYTEGSTTAIAGPSATFTVSSATFTLPALTLTVPTAP